MSLNIPENSSRRLLKYHVPAGRWKIREDDQDVELQSPVLTINLHNLGTGYVVLKKGEPADWVMNRVSTKWEKNPDRGVYRPGFRVLLTIEGQSGVFEFSSGSRMVLKAIDLLHTEFDLAVFDKKLDRSILPVVVCKRVTAVKTPKGGENYMPTLGIVDWVARSEDLPDEPPYDRPNPETDTESSHPAFDDTIPDDEAA